MIMPRCQESGLSTVGLAKAGGRRQKRGRPLAGRIITAAVGFGLLQIALGAQERKFYPDDPVLRDLVLLEVPEEPAEVELSDMFDRFGHIFAEVGDDTVGEA